jgi:uncharacterized membrane protein
MYGFWLFLHLSAVVIWVGGMFFVLHCLNPAVADLQPQQRAPLMISALGRFFNLVLIALVLIWVSGFAMLLPIGFKDAPLGWHIMLTIGLVMTLIFLSVRFGMYPRASRYVASADLQAAGRIMGRIRPLVLLNMVLGFVAIGAVSLLT